MKLGVAHLAISLTEATKDSDLAGLVLAVGATRAEDRLIEVHIHGQINIRNIDCVSLDQIIDDDNSKLEWTFAKEKLRSTRVSVTERASV